MSELDTSGPAVVLLSGGLDSMVTAAIARERGMAVHALTIDYGQRHIRELQSARSIAEKLGVKRHVELPLDLRQFGGSALTDDIDVPKGGVGEGEGIPVTYVPARNLVFLALTTAFAETSNSRDIFIGVNALDYSGYPDCRDDTMKAMQLALSLGMDKRFLIETPLMWIDKADTWRLAHDIGEKSGELNGGEALVILIVEHTHTCYLGDRVHRHAWGYGCGTCPACELRARGFERFAAAS